MKNEPRSCRRATELISASMDRSLSRAERASLVFHLTVCRPCRVFRRQLSRIRAFLRAEGTKPLRTSFLETTLSSTARDRIRAALQDAS